MGSCTVSVLQFPAWGILTRFHGSAPGRTAAAILSGAGETGKAEEGESELSGLGGRGRKGGDEGRAEGRGPSLGAEPRPARTSGKGEMGYF